MSPKYILPADDSNNLLNSATTDSSRRTFGWLRLGEGGLNVTGSGSFSFCIGFFLRAQLNLALILLKGSYELIFLLHSSELFVIRSNAELQGAGFCRA